MTQTTAPSPAEAVAAATQEAEQAEQQLASLEERVRDGDDTITPAQLAEQRELGRFARLRVDAARRQAERRQEQDRARDQAAARAQVHAEAADDRNGAEALVSLLDAYEHATTALLDALQEHNQRVTRWARLIGNAGVTPRPGAVPEADGLGVTPRHDRVRIDGHAFAHLSGGKIVSAALHRAAEGYPFDFIRDAGGREPGQPLRESTTPRDMIRKAAR
jgi:hypothetical protein